MEETSPKASSRNYAKRVVYQFFYWLIAFNFAPFAFYCAIQIHLIFQILIVSAHMNPNVATLSSESWYKTVEYAAVLLLLVNIVYIIGINNRNGFTYCNVYILYNLWNCSATVRLLFLYSCYHVFFQYCYWTSQQVFAKVYIYTRLCPYKDPFHTNNPRADTSGTSIGANIRCRHEIIWKDYFHSNFDSNDNTVLSNVLGQRNLIPYR